MAGRGTFIYHDKACDNMTFIYFTVSKMEDFPRVGFNFILLKLDVFVKKA